MSCCACPATPFLLDWYPGDTAAVRATFAQADGTPYDLTLAQPRLIVASSDEAGATTLWDLTLADGAILLDVAGGIAVFSPGSTRSAALAGGRTYPARLVLTTADGEVLSLRPGYLQTYQPVPAPAA
jgi:hypothetical protein